MALYAYDTLVLRRCVAFCRHNSLCCRGVVAMPHAALRDATRRCLMSVTDYAMLDATPPMRLRRHATPPAG